MLDCADRSPGLVLVRLYTWSVGTITFGQNQDSSKVVDYDKLNGTPLIRRITGGRALFHEPSELTYSLAVNTSDQSIRGLDGTISQTYENISRALVRFLDAIKIEAQYMRQSSPEFLDKSGFHTQPCFHSRGRFEIVGSEQKIIASAQKRTATAFLQHGSIKINGIKNHPALPPVVNNSLERSAIGSITKDSFGHYANSFKKSFNDVLGLNLSSHTLDSPETAAICDLTSQIQKNPQNRREPIKQNAVRTGLSTG